MRAPIRRRATLKARVSAVLYICDPHGPRAGSCIGLWEGIQLLDLGTDVTLEFDPTIPAWWIMSP